MRRFKVMTAVCLGYDSHVHRPTPSRHKRHEAGTVLRLSSEAPNGNVWFFDPAGERGVVACGEVRNLLRDGRVVELFETETRCDHG